VSGVADIGGFRHRQHKRFSSYLHESLSPCLWLRD
jgi:hypothetical protein